MLWNSRRIRNLEEFHISVSQWDGNSSFKKLTMILGMLPKTLIADFDIPRNQYPKLKTDESV